MTKALFFLSKQYAGPGAGPGYVAGEFPDGLVTVNGAVAAREIEARHRKTRKVAATHFSAADGTYRFDGLDPGEEFDVIGRDYSGVYNDVIVSHIKPYNAPDLSQIVVPTIHPSDAVSWRLIARYGEPPLTWSASGLPSWLSLSGDIVTGTAPDITSTTPITITCADAHAQVSTRSLNIDVALPALPAWWRVLVLASNSTPNYASTQELEFRATAGGSTLCVGGTPFASSYFSPPSFLPALAFDGDTTSTTVPECWAADGVEATPFLGYHMTAGSAVQQIMLCARHAYPTQTPKDFKIQSSTDGMAWTDEWSVSGQTSWTAGEIRVFTRP